MISSVADEVSPPVFGHLALNIHSFPFQFGEKVVPEVTSSLEHPEHWINVSNCFIIKSAMKHIRHMQNLFPVVTYNLKSQGRSFIFTFAPVVKILGAIIPNKMHTIYGTCTSRQSNSLIPSNHFTSFSLRGGHLNC